MSRQPRAEVTRAQLLEAAFDCFVQDGYAATSVAQICRCAGVSKGAFYHHFPSKQALFMDLLDHWLSDLDARLEQALASAVTVPHGLLFRVSEMVRSVFDTSDRRVLISFEFFNQAHRDPQVWQQAIEPYRRYRSFFARLIEAGVAEGSIRPMDSERMALVVVSLTVGLLMQRVLDPQDADWGLVADEAVQLLLAGLQV